MITEKTGARSAGAPATPRPPGTPRLVFDHVQFCFPGASKPLLTDVCLALQPGETIALVGAMGSGKTALLQLVPRLADVTGGAILLDGTDIRDLPLRELRTRVGCAFEDPTLFSASVSENIALGAPGAAASDIEAAIAAAQAGFVHDLPWDLATRIGEQGMSLSGGQRQRVALARAILTRPAVLVLDDPLSALDVHTEAKVTAALTQILASSTALVVAHRPSTVLLADRVALLADGVIAALGTHRELLATEPRYRELMGPGPGWPAVGTDAAQDLTGSRS
jgi:ATP-binding cassette subfamily B protein